MQSNQTYIKTIKPAKRAISNDKPVKHVWQRNNDKRLAGVQ